jgi:hypothetical protein
MDPIKLAYMAEFAVALNLIFAEFRFVEVSEKLAKLKTEIFVKYQGGEFLQEVDQKVKAYKDDGFSLSLKENWFVISLSEFSKLWSDDPQVDGVYVLFARFFKRAMCLCGIPITLKTTARALAENVDALPIGQTAKPAQTTLLKIKPPYSFYVWRLLVGVIASWTFSKLPEWRRSPCAPSKKLCITVLISAFAIIIVGCSSNPGIPFSIGLVTLPSAAVAFAAGLVIAFVLPRLATACLEAIFKGEPFSPRAKFYALTHVILSSFIVVFITMAAGEKVPLHSAGWWAIFGYLLGAMAFPLVLSFGLLAVEKAFIDWKEWMEPWHKLKLRSEVESMITKK